MKNVYAFTKSSPTDESPSSNATREEAMEDLLKKREKEEKRLREEIAELTQVNEALSGEVAKFKRTEQALRETEENFRLLMNYSGDAVNLIKQMKDQVEEAGLKAKRGKMLVTAFIHDLKGPLALVSSCAQFCIGNLPLVPPLVENLKIIYESAQRANNLIRKFLELFESQSFKFQPININGVVTKAWAAAQQDTQAFQVDFESQMGSDLPDVMGDAEALERVFFNLFLNAIQALSKKGKVTAQTQFLPRENRVEVNIIDNGPGIPQELQHKIFQPFFTTKEEGTGLGLSISRLIIGEHEGTIQVGSMPGGGAKILIKLPVA
ncbi:MAG: ATP-binding protein [Deltaproteobacteria bacterium]|nr:ATP-binding protein [Deltaproteobacteria bacterium]